MFAYVDATPAGIFNPDDDLWHHIYKRDADEGEEKEGGGNKILEKIKDAPNKIKNEVNKDVKIIAEKTHIPTWGIFTIFAVIVLVVIGLIGWCVWRFMKKKKTKRCRR